MKLTNFFIIITGCQTDHVYHRHTAYQDYFHLQRLNNDAFHWPQTPCDSDNTGRDKDKFAILRMTNNRPATSKIENDNQD